MPEVEQKEALHMLAKNKIEVEAQLQGLPLVVESPGLVNTKARYRSSHSHDQKTWTDNLSRSLLD